MKNNRQLSTLSLAIAIALNLSLITHHLSAQNNNGKLDTVAELYKKENVAMLMHDGLKLNTDVYYPKLMDSYKTTFNIPLPGLGQSDTIILLNKGTMLFKYPNQPDSSQLPTVLLRTPYDSRDAGSNVYLFPLLGYSLVVQDERGRYLSEGTYIPFYNDSWTKDAYGLNKFLLDPTPDSSMRKNWDGAESVHYIIDSLQIDKNDDGLPDYLISNGDVGMYGGSAEGYSQYQAAAAEKINPSGRGLKCLMPIVATGEFQQSTSAPNGVYREALVKGWLTHVMGVVDTTNSLDSSIYNNMHTPSDYGLTTTQELIDTTIFTYTNWKQNTYPNSPSRSNMDISQAPVNQLGQSDINGTYSRYSNMDLPIFHISGWWDIFTEGQIATFNNVRNNVNTYAHNRQKLVVGPWTHQTITMNEVGDQRGVNAYPSSVYQIFGNFGNINNLASSDGFVKFLQSELVTWYRGNLGEPVVVFPTNNWQKWSSTSSYKIKIPAQNYTMSYADFINFLLGIQGLSNFPIALQDTTTGVVNNLNYNLPATGKSIFGDTATTPYVPLNPIWDETANNGVKAVRVYIVGPTNDATNPNVGNYWMESDFFPNGADVQKWYFHSNNTIDTSAVSPLDSLAYLADPNNPVQTIGGGNMVIPTPDLTRQNNGQMNLLTWDSLTMNRPDVLQFQSTILTDTLSVIGFPKISLWASLAPISSNYPDSANGDFVVRIIDVYPSGRELYVTEGAVNARAREYAKSKALGNENINAVWSNLSSNKIYNFYFKSLPLGYTFGIGHRIKILISSSNYPRYQSCHNMPLQSGDFLRIIPGQNTPYNFHGVTLHPQTNNVKLFTDGNYASFIELPVYKGILTSVRDEYTNTPSNKIKIYPNPNNGNFTIFSNTKIQKIELYNLTGKLILLKNNFHTNKLYVNLPTNFPKGIYFVVVHTLNQQTVTKKIILN